jgi:tetratricopeptide (TPR) repeat protein
MRRTLVLCLMTLVFVTASAFAQTQARLTGKVTDAATKAPIADATITIEAVEGKTFKQTIKTKKDGTYAVMVLDGTLRYKFSYAADGYAPVSDTMKLKLGEPNKRDITLSKGGDGGGTAGAGAQPQEAKGDPVIEAYNAAAALANEGKIAEAIAKMEEAIAAKPDLTAAHMALAKLYARVNAWDKAVVAANKGLEVDNEDMAMWQVLHAAYTAKGDKVKAAEAAKKLPANANGLFNDAARAINAGKDAEAEPLLKQAIVADDKFAIAYYELGMLYVRAGNNAGAKENLTKYLELEPNGKDAPTAKEMLKYVK